MATSLRQPTGTTTVERRRAAAGVLVLGAGGAIALTLIGVRPVVNILLLGVTLVLAWLVDGSPRRYIGPGLAAVAVGGGLTLGGILGFSSGTTEHVLVYTLVGVAVLVMSAIHPENVRGGALLLILVGASAAMNNFVVSYNLNWQLVAILASWGILAFVQASRVSDDGRPVDTDGVQTSPAAPGERSAVDAGAHR